MSYIYYPVKDIRLRDSDSKVLKHQDEGFKILTKFCSCLRTGRYKAVLG